jgi:hypothetical protein
MKTPQVLVFVNLDQLGGLTWDTFILESKLIGVFSLIVRPNARDSETHFRKHEKLPRFLSLIYFYIFNRVNFIHQVSNLSL